MTIILALIIFSLLVLVHEGGHFLAAKRAGIRVEEFAIGLGPALWQFKRGETIYSLRLFPLGGFNRISGMDGFEANDPRGFNCQPLLKRMGVIAAGSGMNFLLAVFLFVLTFTILGSPTDSNVIGRVGPGKPAAQAGLESGDRVLAINDIPINSWTEMVELIHNNPETKISLLVERGNQQKKFVMTTVRDPESGVGLIGIEPTWERQGLWRSIIMGFQQAIAIAILLLSGLVQMIIGRLEADVMGPVGIVQLVGQAATFGVANILNFTALLSVNLGLINLLPIPALDGSRLAFLAAEAIRGKPLNPEKENFIHLIGFALLIGLFIVITYQDIIRIFS